MKIPKSVKFITATVAGIGADLLLVNLVRSILPAKVKLPAKIAIGVATAIFSIGIEKYMETTTYYFFDRVEVELEKAGFGA